MAGALLSRGGSEDGWVEGISIGAVVVVIQTSRGKEITLALDNEVCLIEEKNEITVDFRQDVKYPKVEVSSGGKVICSRVVSAENIQPITARFF